MQKSEGSLIIIAHLGKNERSRIYNARRLHNIRAYFVVHSGIPSVRVIPAEGTNSEGQASVELYLGGNLVMQISADRGKDIRVDCCDDFPDYYPWYRGKPILK